LGDASLAVELLLASDSDRALDLASALGRLNDERRRIEQSMRDEAAEMLAAEFDEREHAGIVVAKEGWHLGAVGLVAGKLSARFHRPAAVVTFTAGMGRGSCRSVEGVDVVKVLDECSSLLDGYGGHALAAGLSVRQNRFDAFRECFLQACRRRLPPDHCRPIQQVDAWVAMGEADGRMLAALDGLRPFGTGNPEPVWGAEGVRVVGCPRVVGNGHLKMVLASGGTQREAVGFGMAERVLPAGPLDILFAAQANTYHGRTSIQLHLKDFRASRAEGRATAG
jgi:single-stranded-DNA-specific exonuclease